MNSVFLNYSTSYFDLINTSALLPSYGSDKLIKSSDGKLVESGLSLDSDDNEEAIYTTKTSLGFGQKRIFNSEFNEIRIGRWVGGDIGYPNFNCHIYPTTTLHHGLKFTPNPEKYNNSDLWVNNVSGALRCRDRNVAISDDGVVNGNIAFFGSNGVLVDNLVGISSGIYPLTLNIPGSDTTVGIDVDYNIFGKKIVLTLRKFIFNGSALANPNGFQTQTDAGKLPLFLRPFREISLSLLIYSENGGQAQLINQVGFFRLGGINTGTVEIFKSPDKASSFSSSGAFDGWESGSITYFTN